MRLNRLDLIRYGRFKDAALTFPRPVGDAPDVTVVFGPNEAGKSTTFNGFLELLFGFKSGAHPYAFRYERSDLLVGAELDLPGRGAMVLRRNSKRTQSLLDAQDRPLNDAILSGALHGLTRDSYEERFSLNESGLREGGARIAGAQGDLGQLLHAGLSGMTGMARTLDALAERADRFHKKHGKRTVLKIGSDRLKEIGRDLRADRLTSERERALRQTRDDKAAAFEAANGALQQSHQRQAAALAAQVWYDHSAEIARLSEALTEMPAGPDLPAGAGERVAALVEKIAAGADRIAEAQDEIDRQDQVIAAHPANVLAAPLQAELDRLDEQTFDGATLFARATTALRDLDARIKSRDELSGQIDAVLAQLAAPGVPAAALALEGNALEALASAVQDCLTARLSAAAAEEAVASARAQQGAAPAKPRDLTALRAAYEDWTTLADLTAFEAEQGQTLARLTRAAAGLPGSWRGLIDAGLPARETLQDLARDWGEAQAQLASAQGELTRQAAELVETRSALAALAAAPDSIDIAATEATRRDRDLAWMQHRAELSDSSAGQFEAAMHADDGSRAHYLTGAETRQRLLAAQTRSHAAEAQHDGAMTRHAAAAADLDQLSTRAARLAQALGLDADTAPSAFGARLQALSLAAEAAADHTNADAALTARSARQQAARATLNTVAAPLGLDPGQVQRALTLEDSDRRAWNKWQEGEQAIAALVVKAQQNQSLVETAEQALDHLSAMLPLPDRSLERIRAALPHLRRLHQLHGEHVGFSARVEAMELAIAAFEQGAQRLARILTEDTASADPVQIIDAARMQVQAAARADEKRAEAVQRRDEAARARLRAETGQVQATEDLAACFAGQGAAELAPPDRIARLAERDRLRAEMRGAGRARDAARAGVDADLFIAELAHLPDATRAALLAQDLQDAQGLRDSARDAQREAERLYAAAFAAAEPSDLATEQATLLEELRGGARQAAVARLGVLAARGALRSLAAERRSSMLRDVEEAFVSMTVPAWTGVDVWSQAEGDKLVGIQPDGSTVPVEQMSTGTMGQLYFALRLAGYRSFARDPGPLPMILDDIMETFDDARALAALRLCAGIGTSGQAILFTHHAHLVELARDGIPGVSVVTMPA